MTDMTQPRSHCCLAPRKEVSGHEGTGYYICWACGEEFIDENDYCINCKRHEGETCEFCDPKVGLKPEAENTQTVTPASYSNITDEERRQTYDYKMGYLEGMMAMEKENTALRTAIMYCSGTCHNALKALSEGENTILKRYQDNAWKQDLDKQIE